MKLAYLIPVWLKYMEYRKPRNMYRWGRKNLAYLIEEITLGYDITKNDELSIPLIGGR